MEQTTVLDKNNMSNFVPKKDTKIGEKFSILSQYKENNIQLISRDGTDFKRFTITQNSKITIFFGRYFFTFLTLNLNLWNNRAINKKTAFFAKLFLREHAYSSWGNIPSTRSCLSSFKKRSGRKVKGSTQYSMSWWIAQRLTNTVTSRRMKKPAMVVSRGVGWGIAWGVSLTMRTISVKNASKQGKFGLITLAKVRHQPLCPTRDATWPAYPGTLWQKTDSREFQLK